MLDALLTLADIVEVTKYTSSYTDSGVIGKIQIDQISTHYFEMKNY